MSTGLGLDGKSAEIKVCWGSLLLIFASITHLLSSTQSMKSLGAAWTDSSAATVTHLVVKAISRTEKFLSCEFSSESHAC